MLYANIDDFGGDFLNVVEAEINSSKNLSIATGYVSLDIVSKFKGNFERIAGNGGTARLLLGMAFYEGLTSNKLAALREMDESLERFNNGSGVFVSYCGRYHGKIYKFETPSGNRIYVGSSNFSRSGLSGNIECTALIEERSNAEKLSRLIDFLFDKDNAASILKADIVIPGSNEYGKKISLQTLDDLEKYDPLSINLELLPKLEFPLRRIADKEKSNLNVYFGKGRWNRTTDKVIPRPWYEVELIADKSINSQPLYPKGSFLAYTDDGYIIPMMTSGDYFKNIRSKGSLSILGQWIKGKLQKKGALLPLTPVTQDTLDAYGSDKLEFYKMGEGKYYMKF